MRWPVLVLVLVTSVGCAGLRPPDPMTPPVGGAPSEQSSSRPDADEDEAAEERAIVNDPRVIASARDVRVIQNDSLDCPSEVLGLVDIHEPVDSVDRALEVLKRKAAKVGAEAVIGVEFHHGEPGEEPTHLSGMAVRCNDLIKGRKYDVLGRIEVPGKMGDEDGAEHELMARARAMRADLVIDMGFEHGEGGQQPTKVWGTAIRFR
jgi:uncharacterized protein YbjQ (UPF0145 family)